jgi:hypothetical protein
MLRTIIAAIIGGLATFLFLVFWDATDFTTPLTAYFLAGVVGAIGTLIWPAIVGIWFARRAKNRRDEKIQEEVDRQIAQKG